MVHLNAALALALLSATASAQEIRSLQNPGLEEISGLTRSLADPQILWAHNDSGNAAVLYRLGLDGENLGEVRLAGGPLLDWEDIASFQWNDQPALLLADVGDNFAFRDHLTLYAVRDPGRGSDARLLWSLDFRYPDGARDCEAVAVDSKRAEILLLSKADRPPRLYRLPLPQSPPKTSLVAEFLGVLRGIAPLSRRERLSAPMASRHFHSPTAMDISTDGRRLAVITPRNAYIYRRTPQQSWGEAVGLAPRIIPLPPLKQIEAGAFSIDGSGLQLASEGRPPKFVRVPLPD